MTQPFSHLDESGNPGMVDVGGKPVTRRTAVARARMELPPEVTAALQDGDIITPKGPVFQTAIIAGTMAVKRTAESIPFCHPVPVDRCRITIEPDSDGSALTVTCEAGASYVTGVEMEALHGAAVASLTIYDMCKSISHGMVIRDLGLVRKTGGASGDIKPEPTA